MSRKDKNNIKANNKKFVAKNKTNTTVNDDFLAETDNFFLKHSKTFFISAIIATVILGGLLFNMKIDEGADDSGYIVSAKDFLSGERFPTWHGSLYPIFLSLPMFIFGINVFAFKIISYFFTIGCLVLLYHTFKNKVPASLLFYTIIFTSVNSFILFYASTTYNEAFYMLIQIIAVFYFFKLLDESKESQNDFKKHWKKWLLFGLFMFLLSNTKNIGISFLIAVLIFFLLNKNYLNAIYSFCSYLIFQIPYSLYKELYWNFSQTGYEGQFSATLMKDPYNKLKGQEDISGFITRFFDNSNLYLSKNLFKILGLKPIESDTTNGLLTVLTCIILLISFYFAFRKNKYLKFLSIYSFISLVVTFIVIQTLWDQPRLILIFVPFIFLIFFFAMYELSKLKKFSFLKGFIPVIFVFLILFELKQTFTNASNNIPILRKNINGDKYYGYTTNLVNYLKMSEWASKNLPQDAVIACRKPSMSFIYGNGRKFYGISRFPKFDFKETIDKLKEGNKSYYIINNILLKTNPELSIKIAPFLQVIVDSKNSRTCIYDFENDTASINLLKRNNIGFSNNIDGLYNTNEEFECLIPDSLYNDFKKNKIKYLIEVEITKAKNKKDEEITGISNAIKRHIYTILMKYPYSFRIVNQIGESDNWPTILYEFE
ncbi:MAG: hypothetical protein PHD97_03795 [Bacteroidales bacterium]|nr:hypothetical protein [Bacteroidales bacterium]